MSIIRQLLVEKYHGEFPHGALAEVALLVRRAGLDHAVADATWAEAQALADAGELLALERVALLVTGLRNPASALRVFDGGEAERSELMADAWARVA